MPLVAWSVQPLASVPVTVYVVVAVGLAVTVTPVVADSPVAGDHTYVVAPVAVIVFDEPIHIEPVGLTVVVTVGRLLTVMVRVASSLQPLVVPVAVYVVVVVGLAVITAPVVADRPVAGAHV
jgi:hypothetical protein